MAPCLAAYGDQDRRHLLGFVATLTAALATLAAARPARAWQVEQLSPKSPLGAALANRCEAASTHVGLIGQLQAQLTKQPQIGQVAARERARRSTDWANFASAELIAFRTIEGGQLTSGRCRHKMDS